VWLGVVGGRDEDHLPWRDIGNSKTVVNVYDGPELHALFGKLFGNQFKTQPNCTWLRMKGRGEITVEHAV